MPRFNDDLSERRKDAATAKRAMLERFRALPAANDPAIVERKAARLVASQERKARSAQSRVALRWKDRRPH